MKVTQMSALGGNNIIRKEIASPKQNINKSTADFSKLFARFEKDDYILLGIIAVLVFEGCDDYILLAALGYLFFMGIKE